MDPMSCLLGAVGGAVVKNIVDALWRRIAVAISAK